MSNRGLLFIVSAPSGTGKTTLVERLVQRIPNLCLSRSYTSRGARPGEQDGVDYNFISRDRFEQMARGGEFLEWADVFGNYYGTCAGDTERCLAGGKDLVLTGGWWATLFPGLLILITVLALNILAEGISDAWSAPTAPSGWCSATSR